MMNAPRQYGVCFQIETESAQWPLDPTFYENFSKLQDRKPQGNYKAKTHKWRTQAADNCTKNLLKLQESCAEVVPAPLTKMAANGTTHKAT